MMMMIMIMIMIMVHHASKIILSYAYFLCFPTYMLHFVDKIID